MIHRRRDRRRAIDFDLVNSATGQDSSYAARNDKRLQIESTIFRLADTVTTYEEANGNGTGVVFHYLRPNSLADTIGWAVSTWYERPAHIEQMRRRAMARDHSWDRSAREYLELYLAAYARRRGHAFAAAPERRVPTPAVAKPAPIRVAVARPFERLPLPARHARAPVGRRRA